MKPNDCIVLYEGQDTFKCVLNGQEFSMTHSQFETLCILHNQASNMFVIEPKVFKCAYVNENNDIKVICK